MLKSRFVITPETQKTISLDQDAGEQNREIKEPEEIMETQERINEKHDEATTRKTVQFRTAEPVDTIEDMTEKTKDQTELPDSPPKQQHQHQQQPGMDVKQTPTPQDTLPATIQPTRSQTRPKRERILPARYRN